MGKIQYFGSGWNWIDINMIGLVFISYSMWVIMFFVNPQHKDETYTFILSFPESFFAVAIILSFFRMVCLCQITRYLGLLQLCLGRMLQVSFDKSINLVSVWLGFNFHIIFILHCFYQNGRLYARLQDIWVSYNFVCLKFYKKLLSLYCFHIDLRCTRLQQSFIV